MIFNLCCQHNRRREANVFGSSIWLFVDCQSSQLLTRHCDGRLTSLFLVDYCCVMLILWLVIC